MSADYTSTVLDSMNGNISFTNPVQPNIDNISTLLATLVTDLTALNRDIFFPVASLTALDVPGKLSAVTGYQATLAAYKVHTDALTNVTQDATEPSFQFILSATDTIKSCKDLSKSAVKQGKDVPADMAEVADMDQLAVVSSITKPTAEKTSMMVTEAQALYDKTPAKHAYLVLQLDKEPLVVDPPLAIPPLDPDPSDKDMDIAVAEYEPVITACMDSVVAIMDSLQNHTDTDKANYFKIKAVNEKLGQAGLAFMGLSNPMLGSDYSDVIK